MQKKKYVDNWKTENLSGEDYWWVAGSDFEGILQISNKEESNSPVICISKDNVTAFLIKSILVAVCKDLSATSWIFSKTCFPVL